MLLRSLAAFEMGLLSRQKERAAVAEALLFERRNHGFHVDIPASSRSCIAVAFSTDGTLLASCHSDHHVRVTDIETGKVVALLKGHSRTPWAVTFFPKCRDVLFTGDLAGVMIVWNVTAKQEIHRFSFPEMRTRSFTSLTFLHDKSLLGVRDSNVTVFRLRLALDVKTMERDLGSEAAESARQRYCMPSAAAPEGMMPLLEDNVPDTFGGYVTTFRDQSRGDSLTDVPDVGVSFALASHDGKRLAYCTREPGVFGPPVFSIHLTRVTDNMQVETMCSDAIFTWKGAVVFGPGSLSFSSDGRFLAFPRAGRSSPEPSGTQPASTSQPGARTMRSAKRLFDKLSGVAQPESSASPFDGGAPEECETGDLFPPETRGEHDASDPRIATVLSVVCTDEQDPDFGKEVSRVRLPRSILPTCVRFSPSGSYIAVGCSHAMSEQGNNIPVTVNECMLYIFELSSGKCVQQHEMPVLLEHNGIEFRPIGGAGLAVASSEGPLVIFDCAEKRVR